MRKFIYILFILFSTSLFAQNPVENVEKNIHKHSLSNYQVENQILIQMPYASNLSKDFKKLDSLKNKKITHIDLVYTDYPKGRDFTRLNRSRLEILYRFAPHLFENQEISWNYVAQTDCNSVEQGQKMFHGFAVHFQEASPEELAKVEEKKLNRQKDSITITKKIEQNYVPKDSTVTTVLNRFGKWKNMLIVNDWTGSMYEHGLQVVVWYKLNTDLRKNVKKLVFFNDGNETQDQQKKIGNTGGIYMTDSLEISHIVSKMLETMQNGWGGDTEENDVEAILKGIEACPDCENVVLIADSQSKVRDLKLVHKIKKPVRVILCGAKNRIVPDYLEIAYKTGGSLHTIEDDLENLVKLNNGSVIEFAGYKFQIIDGKFVEYPRRRGY